MGIKANNKSKNGERRLTPTVSAIQLLVLENDAGEVAINRRSTNPLRLRLAEGSFYATLIQAYISPISDPSTPPADPSGTGPRREAPLRATRSDS